MRQVSQSADYIDLDHTKSKQFLTNNVHKSTVSFVLEPAWSGYRVIGFVMGTLAYGELGLTQVTSILDTIAVHPHYQQQGIGRQMIETFIKQSLAQGGPAVYMLVNGDNWSLLKVFHSLGFVLTPMILLERQID